MQDPHPTYPPPFPQFSSLPLSSTTTPFSLPLGPVDELSTGSSTGLLSPDSARPDSRGNRSLGGYLEPLTTSSMSGPSSSPGGGFPFVAAPRPTSSGTGQANYMQRPTSSGTGGGQPNFMQTYFQQQQLNQQPQHPAPQHRASFPMQASVSLSAVSQGPAGSHDAGTGGASLSGSFSSISGSGMGSFSGSISSASGGVPRSGSRGNSAGKWSGPSWGGEIKTGGMGGQGAGALGFQSVAPFVQTGTGDAFLPPISQDFARPSAEMIKRPATYAGVPNRSASHSGGATGGAGGWGGFAQSGTEGGVTPNQGSVQPTGSMDGSVASSRTVGATGRAAEVAEEEENVFAHTVDGMMAGTIGAGSSGGGFGQQGGGGGAESLFGGPVFQDPFSMSSGSTVTPTGRRIGDDSVDPMAPFHQPSVGQMQLDPNGMQGQPPYSATSSGGGSISGQMQGPFNNLGIGGRGPLQQQQQSFHPANSRVSLQHPSSSFAVNPAEAWNNTARRASEPHFKAQGNNISLPSHATLYQTLGLGPLSNNPGSFPPLFNNPNTPNKGMAMVMARRGSKGDIGDLNTNQLRHLIAERRGSVDVPIQRHLSMTSIHSGGAEQRGSSAGSLGGTMLGSSPMQGIQSAPALTPAQLYQQVQRASFSSQGSAGGQGRGMTMPGPQQGYWDSSPRYGDSAGSFNPQDPYGSSPSSARGSMDRRGSSGMIPGGIDPATAALPALSDSGNFFGRSVPRTLGSNPQVLAQAADRMGVQPGMNDNLAASYLIQQSGFPADGSRSAPLVGARLPPRESISSDWGGNQTGDDQGGSYSGSDDDEMGGSQGRMDPSAPGYEQRPASGPAQKKRPRRKFDQIERLYLCGFDGCEKSYGTLNHLNAHVNMQKHGIKRKPDEFKEIRKAWRKKKKEEAARIKRGSPLPAQHPAPPMVPQPQHQAVRGPPLAQYQAPGYPVPPVNGTGQYLLQPGPPQVDPNYAAVNKWMMGSGGAVRGDVRR